MKKTILVALMAVMIATPCFAQEIEPDGLFSLEGTLWGVCAIAFNSYPSFSISRNCNERLGFYQGKVYSYTDYGRLDIATYADLGVVSVAWDISFANPINYYLAFMQPTIGFGAFTWGEYGCGGSGVRTWCNLGYEIGIMYKTDDNWTPSEIE